MYRLILLLVLTYPLAAQVIVSKTQITVTATAGATVCTATSTGTPNISVQCTAGNDKPFLSGPISVGAASGTSFTYNTPGGGITFLFSLLAAGNPVTYSATTAPTGGCPAGTTCTANGTF